MSNVSEEERIKCIINRNNLYNEKIEKEEIKLKGIKHAVCKKIINKYAIIIKEGTNLTEK